MKNINIFFNLIYQSIPKRFTLKILSEDLFKNFYATIEINRSLYFFKLNLILL